MDEKLPPLLDYTIIYTSEKLYDSQIDEVDPRDPRSRDYAEILEGKLWLANEQTAFNYRLLRKLGVKQILTIGTEIRQHTANSSDFEKMRIDIDDIHVESLLDWFSKTNEFIDKAPTLVHCMMGISRSSSVVLAYLMYQKRMTLAEAFEHVSLHRDISPNTGFFSQLTKYEKTLDLASKTRCDNCDRTDTIYFRAYYHKDRVKSKGNVKKTGMYCATCTATRRGHILYRIFYSVTPSCLKDYKNLIENWNRDLIFNSICSIQIGHINGDTQDDLSRFHNNLNIALKVHPANEGYVENPMIYANLIYFFYTRAKKQFMVLHSDHLVLTILMSVFFDSVMFPNHSLEKVFYHNAQIIANISDDDANGLNHFGKKLVGLIQEHQNNPSELTHYIPRYYVDPKFDMETGSLENMEKKYPDEPEWTKPEGTNPEKTKTNKIKRITCTDFADFIRSYQKHDHLVTYSNALYGKHHYQFIREVLDE